MNYAINNAFLKALSGDKTKGKRAVFTNGGRIEKTEYYSAETLKYVIDEIKKGGWHLERIEDEP